MSNLYLLDAEQEQKVIDWLHKPKIQSILHGETKFSVHFQRLKGKVNISASIDNGHGFVVESGVLCSYDRN